MQVKAFEVFNPVTGITFAVVKTEREAWALSSHGDFEEVTRAACYCDSAYHPLGH